MSVVYGIVLIVVGSIGDSLGTNLISLGHKEHQDKSTSTKGGDLSMSGIDLSEMNTSVKPEEKESLCSWCMIGRIVFVLGSLFSFASFAFAAQSLIASLESVQFVSNVVFVHYVHHEVVTRRMFLATLSIVLGNILVVIFASHKAQKFTSDDMIYLYKTNNVYHAYLVLAFIIWATTSYAYSTYKDSRMNKRILMWNHSFMEPFCYAVSSSVIGTQAVLNSKCLALLLDATTTGVKNEFLFWYFYFVLGTWLLLVAYWLIRLDGGLALFPPAFIIPVIQVFFVFFAIICGGIYFQEFTHFTVSQYIGFIAGVSMILSGVYGLAPFDLELFVPGDPRALEPVKIGHTCGTATVHPEIVLPKGEDDTDLDQMFDGELKKKPQPDGEDEVEAHAHVKVLFAQTEGTQTMGGGSCEGLELQPLCLRHPPALESSLANHGLDSPAAQESPTVSTALLGGRQSSTQIKAEYIMQSSSSEPYIMPSLHDAEEQAL